MQSKSQGFSSGKTALSAQAGIKENHAKIGTQMQIT
jgi:hypothetical protein